MKTLQKQIESPRVTNIDNTAHSPERHPVVDQYNEHIMNIHKRVTSIVVKQIDLQLNKLEESLFMNNNSTSNPTMLNTGLKPDMTMGQTVNDSSPCAGKKRKFDQPTIVDKAQDIIMSPECNTEEDCFIVRTDGPSPMLSAQPDQYQKTSRSLAKPQRNNTGNYISRVRHSQNDKRRQTSTFVNTSNKCMTKSLAREKYKQTVSKPEKNTNKLCQIEATKYPQKI